MQSLGRMLDRVQKDCGFDLSLAIAGNGSFPSLL